MSCVLTFDLGTTYFKACLIGGDGAIHALARRPTPVERPREGWREISFEAFFQTILELADELRAVEPAAYGRVRAVCFATQTNSFALLDRTNEPITPLILWNDQRAQGLEAELNRRTDPAALRRETGVPALNPAFAVAKLLWLREQAPDLLPAGGANRRRLLFIGDVLTRWLTGQHVTEAGAAGLSGLVNIHTLRWRRDYLQHLGFDLALPRVRRAGADLGVLQPSVAKALRLRPATRLVLGCLDQYAGAIGAGNVTPGSPDTPGRVSETTGTVLATVSLHEDFRGDLGPRVFQGPTWRRGAYWRMCFGKVSAGLLESLAREEGVTVPTLIAEAEAASETSLRLDRPASAKQDRPVFIGAQPTHTRGQRAQVVLQAVAEALREQILELCGELPDEVRSIGGAARSAYWRQLKAAALGVPVTPCRSPEAASLGAAALAYARLAGVGVETFASRWAP